MNRGFAGLKFIRELVHEKKYFVLGIKNNWKLEFEESTDLVKIGASDDAQPYRVVNFCDLDGKKSIATNSVNISLSVNFGDSPGNNGT